MSSTRGRFLLAASLCTAWRLVLVRDDGAGWALVVRGMGLPGDVTRLPILHASAAPGAAAAPYRRRVQSTAWPCLAAGKVGRLAIIGAMNAPTIIATRESRLALWQAEHVRDTLTARFGLSVELLGMTTRGDQILDRALSKVGGKGLFVKELETALEDGSRPPGRALAEGRAHGPAGRFCAGRGLGARRPARRLRLPATPPWPTCRRARWWAPAACAAWCSC
jgi:hypothetical protein